MNRTISSGHAFGLLLLMSGLYAISFFQRVAVPGTVFNEIQHDFAASAGAVTALSSIYLLIYAVAQLGVGILADRSGGVKIILVSGVLLCAGATLFPLSKTLGTLYLSRALVGLGASGMYLCVVKETDALFSAKNFASMIGLFCVIGYGGGLVGTRPFRYLVDGMGWRHALLSVAILSIVLVVLTGIVGRGVHPPKRSGGGATLKKNIGQVFSNVNVYPLIIAGSINFTLYFSLQSTIGPKFIEDFLRLQGRDSTRYTFVMMLTTMIIMLVSGPLSRVLGNKRKPFLLFASFNGLGAVALLLTGMIFKLPSGCFMLAYAMLAVSAGMTPVTVSFVKELSPRDLAGLAVGTQNTITYVTVATAAGLIGLVLDAFKSGTTISASGAKVYPPAAYLTLFVMMAFFSVISIVAACKSRETHGENVYAIPRRA